MNKENDNIDKVQNDEQEKAPLEINDIKIETSAATEKEDDHPSGCCGSCS